MVGALAVKEEPGVWWFRAELVVENCSGERKEEKKNAFQNTKPEAFWESV